MSSMQQKSSLGTAGVSDADDLLPPSMRASSSIYKTIKNKKAAAPTVIAVPPTRKQPAKDRYEEEEDVPDFRSVVTSKTVVADAPKFTEETFEMREARLERVREFKQMLDSNYNTNNEEEANMADEAARLDRLDSLIKLAETSENLIRTKLQGHVAAHIGRINIVRIYGEICKEFNGPDILEHKVKDPQNAFGSKTDYIQGKRVEPVDTYMGNLENVYVTEITLKNVRSTFPCAIGVLVGEYKGADEKTKVKGTFVPYDNATASVNSDYYEMPVANGEQKQQKPLRFHAIIPPARDGITTTTSFDLFRASVEINDPFGARYPFLTEDIKTITHGAFPSKGIVYFPKFSAVGEWIVENAGFYGWTKDMLPNDQVPEEFKDHLRVPTGVFDTAVAQIQRKFSKNLAVQNLRQYAIRFFLLTNGPFSKLSADMAQLSFMTPEDDENKAAFQTPYGNDKPKGPYSKLKSAVKNKFGLAFEQFIVCNYRQFQEEEDDEEEEEDD